MDPKIYRSLGTTKKRKESLEDHVALQKIFDSCWVSIRDFCRNSPEIIKVWQLKRIKELVTHAFDTVPLYRKKYSAVGFNPQDLKGWSDFEALPLLSKEELINAFPFEFLSSCHDLEFTTRSSGSSGRFVTLAVSTNAIYLDTLQGARQFYFQSGKKSKERDLTLFVYTDPWWVSSINGKFPASFLPTTTSPSEVIRKIEELGPRFLSLYPTYLNRLAGEGVRLSELGLELIVVHSEQSTAKHRLELSKLFGVPVLDEFSSEELTRIALECPFNKYHLEEDACYIEIVDPKTKVGLSAGMNGLVVGTNLLNEATPVIRYSQGDFAAMRGNINCGCGSNFRVLSAPRGRVMDSVVLPDGLCVPAACFMDLAYNWYLDFGVPVHGLRYQIVQSSGNQLDIYLIAGHYKITQNSVRLVKESMYQLIPREMSVFVHEVDAPPINTGKKYRPVISLVDTPLKHV